jgi:nucleoid DNA-binding protein
MATKKKAKKAPKKKATVKKSPSPKTAMKKTAILNEISMSSGLTKKQVSSVFDGLEGLIEGHIKKRGPGQFTLPGLLKIEVKRKPATKARKGINPFTGEETTFKAKPARNVVKIRPLKKMKDMVA